jgi:hypothetical protein
MTRQPKRPPRYLWIVKCAGIVAQGFSTKRQAVAAREEERGIFGGNPKLNRYRLDDPGPKRRKAKR